MVNLCYVLFTSHKLEREATSLEKKLHTKSKQHLKKSKREKCLNLIENFVSSGGHTTRLML